MWVFSGCGRIFAGSFFVRLSRALVGGEVAVLVCAADHELAEPEEFLGVGGDTGEAHHRLAIEAEEDEHRRGAHTVFLEGEVLLAHLAPAEIGHDRIAARIDIQRTEMLAVIVLHFRPAHYGRLHLLTPGTIRIVEHHQHAGLALGPDLHQFLLEISETLIEEVRHRIATGWRNLAARSRRRSTSS